MPKEAFEGAVQSEAQRCRAASPDLRLSIARDVAEDCRKWFAVADNAAFALADATKAEIARAQQMALAFRLPQSVGLRWTRTGRAFSITALTLRVMPGILWLPSKWRILWQCSDWAVRAAQS